MIVLFEDRRFRMEKCWPDPTVFQSIVNQEHPHVVLGRLNSKEDLFRSVDDRATLILFHSSYQFLPGSGLTQAYVKKHCSQSQAHFISFSGGNDLSSRYHWIDKAKLIGSIYSDTMYGNLPTLISHLKASSSLEPQILFEGHDFLRVELLKLKRNADIFLNAYPVITAREASFFQTQILIDALQDPEFKSIKEDLVDYVEALITSSEPVNKDVFRRKITELAI
ncbi:hypothetical protein N9C70_03050 [Flavobacteriales bacterium]|nr:hypothetical protein [Flavobacteriales bacterium]